MDRVRGSSSGSRHAGRLFLMATLLALAALSVAGSSRADTTWSMEASPTAANLYGVALVDSETWVAVGAGGVILRSANGGIDWSPIASPVGDALRAVAFRDTIGIAVDVSGRVIRTTDAGLHWVQQARPTTKPLYGASMGSQGAVITGEEGSIFYSLNDGATWTPTGAGSGSVFFGVSVRGSTAVAVGGAGAVAMSDDAGQLWGLTVIGTLLTFFYGTSFVTPSTGWLVGTSNTIGSIIAKSEDGGFIWSGETAPSTSTLTGVSFTTLTSGTAVGFTGTILHTADGGATWNPETSNTARSLEAVAFRDSLLGIAVGDTGTILRGVAQPVTSADYATPSRFALEVGSNPFRGSTSFSFRLSHAGFATLTIYDVVGEPVATLLDGPVNPGSYSALFDARGLPSGLYYSRLEVRAPDLPRPLTAVRPVVLVR